MPIDHREREDLSRMRVRLFQVAWKFSPYVDEYQRLTDAVQKSSEHFIAIRRRDLRAWKRTSHKKRLAPGRARRSIDEAEWNEDDDAEVNQSTARSL